MKLFDINKAVIDQLKPNLTGRFSTVEFMAEDLAEPIKRHSIKVTLNDPSKSLYTGASTERNLTIRLYFFAQDGTKNKFDNMDMQEIFEDTFIGGLMIDDVFYFIESVDSEITDGVLVTSFDLDIYEEFEEDQGSGEPMETLEINLDIE